MSCPFFSFDPILKQIDSERFFKSMVSCVIFDSCSLLVSSVTLEVFNLFGLSAGTVIGKL
jgi:hypothetical protein